MTNETQKASERASPGQRPGGALLAVLGCAGLTGAAGVALAAVAAHKVSSPALATAAMMLMVHASAAIGIVAVSARLESKDRASGWRWLITAGLMLLAVALFSGAVSYHAVMGEHVFPMAAPFGGSMLIASWCALAVLAVLEALRK